MFDIYIKKLTIIFFFFFLEGGICFYVFLLILRTTDNSKSRTMNIQILLIGCYKDRCIKIDTIQGHTDISWIYLIKIYSNSFFEHQSRFVVFYLGLHCLQNYPLMGFQSTEG